MGLSDNFKLWSETTPEANNFLQPDLGMRDWNDLSKDEKNIMWSHLKYLIFDNKTENAGNFKQYVFYNNYWLYGNTQKKSVINKTIGIINDKYKTKNFCPNYLKKSGELGSVLDFSACTDFINIFLNEDGNIVFELLSTYFLLFFEEVEKGTYGNEEQGKERINTIIEVLNDILKQFGINYILSITGFIPRQEEKIMDIYIPVLKVLSDEKAFKEINGILQDAFDDFKKKDFSGSITHTYSFLQGYLQIKVNGEYQNGNISKLIPKGISDGKIPNDFFTKKIFDNIESIFSFERKEKGDGHPKSEYANEKTALLLLNLAMIFIQHCENKQFPFQ